MVFKNYYKILDLETSHVSIDEIKVAYRQAAKKYHPDLNVGDKLAEERIKDINEAYKTLSVPASKRKYDRIWNSRFGKGEKAFSGKGEKPSIINVFLGNVEEGKEKQAVSKKTAVKGENIETEIHISIQEAFYGIEKTIALRTIEGKIKNLVVAIPQGICDGEKIRLIGQGKLGENGGKNGDLVIKIKIEDSKPFKIKGYDLYTDLLLTPWEAALGTKTSIKSLDEETNIYIPQGIQSGEKIKIPGKGYQDGKGTRGDLIAEIKVVVPKKLTKQERTMFEQLNEISNFNPRKETIL
ncbi:MAG: J domain-containing protein [Clostridia bacterium]|nr:J domain-containing protein [Clostridia bacterium]